MSSAQETLGVSRDHFPENERRTVAAVSSECKRPSCGRVVPTQAFRRGEPRVYCSDSCRRRHWEALHPRTRPEQGRLDLSAAEPVPVPHPASTEPAWLAPDEDFLRHSTEPPEALPQGSPARRQGQGSTRVTPAPATGEPYESARVWLLARLQQGPVSTLELRREPWPASLNPAQRVLELRNRQYRIKTERVEGKTYYRLEQEG